MRWGLLAAGLGAYAVALFATLPATFVDAGLQRASDGRLRLADARGTLWSGAGLFEIRDASRRAGIAKNLAWNFLPRSLLRGHLVCEVEVDHAPRRFAVTISLSRIELTDVNINLPAVALGLGVPKLAPLQFTGDLLLRISSLAIWRGGMRGDATLQWRAAGSALTPVSPLGEYELRLQSAGAAVDASLRTLRGPLQIDGKGSWTSGGSPVFLATAHIPPQHQQQLAPLLRMIAIERGEGRFDLQLR